MIAAIIIISTPVAPAIARPRTNSSPITNRPSSEIMTVMPAKRTARPELFTDSIVDCLGRPALVEVLAVRVTMNSA